METNVKELMSIEGALLLIEERCKKHELKLPFNLRLILKQELKNIGEITDFFINECYGKNKEEIEEMRNCVIDYDLTKCNSFLNSEEIKKFYYN